MSSCERILRKATGLHIDECEAVFVKKNIITVRITDSEIAEVKQNASRSLGIRIIHGKKIMSASTDNPEDLDLLERTLQTGTFIPPRNFWKSLPYPEKFAGVEKTFDKKIETVSGKEATEMADAMINSASHKKITRISGSLNIVSEYFEVGNTNGLSCSDKATYIAGTINADSDYGGIPVSGIGAATARMLDSFSPQQVGSDAKDMCINSVNPRSCEPDTYSIIFEPYAMGEMLAFVFASNFNLKTYSEKRSCFSEGIGNSVAVEDFSLMDDPHFPDGIGSKPFDEEGIPTRARALVESGVFSSTYSDSFYAFKEGLQPTGNASRMGGPMGRAANPIPIPSPHNLRIREGNSSREEMVSDTKKGLIVGRLWYTYPVNPERGDFSCTARSGISIVEDGKIVSAGKPVRIMHNLPVLLEKISCIGNDLRSVLQWHALPCITPSVRVDGIKAVPI